MSSSGASHIQIIAPVRLFSPTHPHSKPQYNSLSIEMKSVSCLCDIKICSWELLSGVHLPLCRVSCPLFPECLTAKPPCRGDRWGTSQKMVTGLRPTEALSVRFDSGSSADVSGSTEGDSAPCRLSTRASRLRLCSP